MDHKEDKIISDLIRAHRQELYQEMPPGLADRAFVSLSPKVESRFWKSWIPVSAVACGVLLVCGITLNLGSPTAEDLLTQEVISGHVRSLMANHLMDVASTDQHTVKPWFEGKLDFAPTVKDFKQDDFPLIGGRLDYLEARPVAALVYKRHLHLINVFEWPAAQASDSKPKLITKRGYQIYRWNEGGMNFWVISDLNAVELQQFVNHLESN
jgi:anti-sigma factor RsiW